MRKLMAAALALAALAACGKGSDNNGDNADKADAAKTPVTMVGTVNNHGAKDATGKGSVELEADDFYFKPTYVKAAPGQSLSIELKNDGKQSHTFTTDAGTDEALPPGGSKTVTLKAPATGVLVYYCRFHRSQGMQGAVYLHEGDAAAPPTEQNGATTNSSSNPYGY